MADGKIGIAVEVDDSSLVNETKQAASTAGKAADSELESGVKSGLKAGANSGGSALESDVKSAGKSAGDSAGKAIGDGVEEGGKEGADGASKAIESIEDAAKKVGGAIAGYFAFDAVTGFLGDAIDAAQEFSGGMGKLGTSAQALGIDFDAANNTMYDFVGLTGDTDTAIEAAGTTMQLCGNDTQKLAEWTRIASGVYAEFGDGLPIEGLTEAANETAKCGQVTGPFADALNWCNRSLIDQGVALSGSESAQAAYQAAIAEGESAEDAFNAALAACNDEGERTELITGTMSAAYGEVGDAYRENNKDLIEYNKAQTENEEAMANLGSALMPLKTGFTEFGTELINRLAPIFQELGETLMPVLQDAFDALWPVIDTLFDAVSPLIELIADVASTILPPIIEGVGDVAQAVADAAKWISDTFSGVLGPVVDWIAGVFGADTDSMQNDMSDVQSSADTASRRVSGSFSSTMKPATDNLSTWFTNSTDTVGKVLDGMGQVADNVTSGIGGAFDWVASNVGSAMQNAKDRVSSFSGWLPGQSDYIGRTNSNMGGTFGTFYRLANNNMNSAADSIWRSVGSIGSMFYTSIPSAINYGLSALYRIGNSMYNVGWNIVRGVWSGISGTMGWLYNKVWGFASNILYYAKRALGIRSPSRMFRDQVGKNIALGIEVGYQLNDPTEFITNSLKAGLSDAQAISMSLNASSSGGKLAGATTQTFNFNTPVATPDVIARQMADINYYGLAGANY